MTSAITESSQGASVEGRAETEHLDSFEGSEFDSKVLPQDAEAPRLATPESAVAKIPPSKVATSLLEPDETISNPFAYDSRSPSPWAEETNLGSQSSDPTRFSTAMNRASASEWGVGKSAQDECAQPDTPSINSNHFSVVSLSSTAPSSAYNGGIPGGPAPNAEEWASPNATRIKRATMTTISGDSPRPLTPKSNGYSEAASNDSKQNYDFLLARLEHQNARLSNDPKAMRASVDGADKLRENFEKLRGQGGHKPRHSRGSSLGKPIAAEANSDAFSGRTSTQDADIRNLIINPVTQTVEPASFKRDSQRASVGASLSDDLDDEDEAINWEFWGNVMSNYQQVARSQPRELSKAIQAGIPAALRGMMWQLMSGSKDEEMEIIYAYYLKQTSPHEKAIRRDLNRTFPEQDYFQEGKGVGQENLFNVVKAYSLYDPECGYCQGMQFVVGPLLLNMPDEEAFSTLVRLMKSYDLRGHYTPNMPSLQLRLFQFDRLLEEFLPLLHMHLVRQGVKSSMYASQWFMTRDSYRFPLDLVYRILDSVFAEGVEALFRFALALMKKNEDQLLKLNFEQAVNFLKQSLFDIYLKPDLVSSSPSKPNSTIPSGQVPGNSTSERQKTYKTNEFVKDAFQIKITPYMLDTYASEFDEQIRAANAHRREVDALRLVNRNLAAKVKSLEEQLGAVNAEHVDLVKQVVMAKIAKEEMAEELVRYKVMYAEAVLQADQELSARCSVNRSSSATSSSKQ
ncbi:RabGAP/TBC [Violaceomyces palustris]|uniref:RabGAP/TBC n=1 Tax=Violaceomyces palustris TaxID=1673888 RepID=A0ACD0NW05_9BASI|nr:RabGAP/TBC [Violaceomyces palustris]